MLVHRDNLSEIVNAAFKAARTDTLQRPRDSYKQHSRGWVNALARQFEDKYARKQHRVFRKDNSTNRKDFGLNELLFDITVCSIDTTDSLQHPSRSLKFITECHWHVESELDTKNTRKAVIDMSKLVLGRTENKLFVAGHRSRQHEVLQQRAKIASCCSGKLFLLFISPPCD